ncbi:RNA-directed DNA polymerase [Vibrio kanaloae]|uniref:RNA-directed DNA polymerase n=1 Tax=Vibrio kanaloae TaxID=170673 RepID=UPI00354DEA34
MSTYKAIGLRAINSYQYISPLTSLGVKIILDQFNEKSIDKFLPAILERKIDVNKKFNTRSHKILKGKDDSGDYEFRTVTFPSPFNALLESYYFYNLDLDKINSSKSVYSYKLNKANNDSYHVFDYYMKNYLQMNHDIAKQLSSNRKKGVLILDIKSFYPSIDKEIAKTIIKERNLNTNILEDSISSQEGVTIGSNFSHLVAQEFLKNFDLSMVNRYRENYFRYVDDILIICDRNEQNQVVNEISSRLPKGLELNESKLDFMNSDYWLDNIEQFNSKNRLDNFFNIVKTYLRYNFDEIEKIDKKLKLNNIFIPTFRLEKEISTSTFFKLFSWLESFGNRKFLSSRKWTTDEFIGYIKEQKSFHLEGINSTIERYRTTKKTKEMYNRFCSQKIKYHVNSLYYLLNDEELTEIASKLPEDDAFLNIIATINAIVNRDFDLAIKCGAKTVATVSELWISRGYEPITFDLSSTDYSMFVDSIIYLILMDVITIDYSVAKKSLDPDSYSYLASVLNLEVDESQLTDFNKEVRSLFSSYKKHELKEKLISRLDKNETIFSTENSSNY